MTSWPWMKGINVAIADPIPPVTATDKRPSVKDLIAEKRQMIDEVKRELVKDPLYDSTKHDDLWILRFLISQKKPKAALKAAKTTLVFRKEQGFDEQDLRPFAPNVKSCKGEAARKLFSCFEEDAFQFVVPDPKLGVFAYTRASGFDPKKLLKIMNEEDWLPAMVYVTEWSFQWQDYTTRTTGRLTKSIRFLDLSGFKLSSFSRKASHHSTEIMHIVEPCYPQGLESVFVVKVPHWIHIVWTIIKPLLPRSVVSKTDVLEPDRNEKEKQRVLPYISEDHLPVRYGGKYEKWPVDMQPPL